MSKPKKIKAKGLPLGNFIQLPIEAYRLVVRADNRENRGSEFFIYEHKMFSDEEAIKLGCNLRGSSSAIVSSVDPIICV